MAGLAGKAGTLKIGATAYAITEWSLNTTCEMLEDSNSKSSGREAYVAGFTGATGSVVAYYDTAEGLLPLVDPGTSVSLILDINGTKTITVPAISNGLDFSMPVKGKVSFTMNFTATGFDSETQLNAL
jgi:hypothetical protein